MKRGRNTVKRVNQQSREWLKLYRELKYNMSAHRFANDVCQLAYDTYLSVENGNKPSTIKTLTQIADSINGLDLNMMLYPTDADGLLCCDSDCVKHMLYFFHFNGLYPSVFLPDLLSRIFTDDIVNALQVIQHHFTALDDSEIK